jgi:hypothetical protein
MKIFQKILLSIILLLLLLFPTFTFAKKVDFATANKIAINWLKYIDSTNVVKDSKIIKFNGKEIAYLFNLSPNGYIIVPIDDILPAIKAYSLTNNYIVHGKIFPQLLEKEIYSLIYSNKFSENIFDGNKKTWNMI